MNDNMQFKNLYRKLYRSEQERAEALEEFQTTIYSIGDGVITTDNEGMIRRMNPMAEALTGWSEAEARGRRLSDVFRIINEESRSEVENPVSKVLREGMITGLANHTILIARDGTERPIADSGAPIRNQEGEIIGVVLVFSDQTEARRMQKALRASEETYRLLFEHAPLGLIHFNGHGIITACNDAFVKIIGSSRQALMGLNMLDLPDKKVVAAVQDAINGGQAIYEGEYHSVTADKKIFVRAVFTSVISCDGRFIGGLGIVEDITERKRAEDALIEERNKLVAVLEALGEGLTVQDKGFKILYQNPAHVKMQGDHLGELCYRAYYGRDSVCDGCLLAKCFKDGQIHRREVSAETANGKIYMEISANPIRDARGDIVAGVEAVRYITEQKELEAQLRQAQKLESVGRLAGGVAHDFNNMLGVITGYTDIALSRIDATSPIYQYLQEIQKAALRSVELTRQLLAFARRQPASPKVVDLNEVVSNMEKILKRLIGEDIEFISIPAARPWSVRIDPSQIDQILVNLVVNARDAIAGTGTITIEIANASLDETYCASHEGFVPGDYVMLAVSDTGIGMDKETQEKIFEPFFTTKEAGKGTGLGLSMVYGIVKQNGGFINVYSESGRGTTFKIYLPRFEGEADQKTAERDESGLVGTETILVVEDEGQILNLVKTVLEGFGYNVLTAQRPSEAVSKCKDFGDIIHLLITDVVMPEMNGKELGRQIERLKPGIKMLFMSGYTANVIAHSGIVSDGINFIQKPFSLNGLAKKIREILDR